MGGNSEEYSTALAPRELAAAWRKSGLVNARNTARLKSLVEHRAS